MMIQSSELVDELHTSIAEALKSFRDANSISEVKFGLIEIHPVHGQISFHVSVDGDPEEIHSQACTHQNVGQLDKSEWYDEYQESGTLVIDGIQSEKTGGDLEVEQRIFDGINQKLREKIESTSLSVKVESWVLEVGYTATKMW